MRERPRGAVGLATSIAEGVAGAVRRGRRDRGPRILLYSAPGEPRLLAPGAKGHDEILDVAGRMVALAKSANSGVE